MRNDRLRVIGLQGSMSAGKSTVRKHLVAQHGAVWVAMAGPFKRALVAMGATEEEIYGALKVEPNELWGGKTNRFALQSIGSGWGRNTMHPDIWVNCVHREIQALWNSREEGTDLVVVIDDVRFPNEAWMIRGFGGTLWTVRRAVVEYTPWKQKLLRFCGWRISRVLGFLVGVHESECWWPMAPHHHVLANEGEESDLRWRVDYIMNKGNKR